MRSLRQPWPELVLLAVAAIWILSGAGSTPFHPDEASLLFQSRDLELLLSDPAEMAWSNSSASSPELTYRLLNAPLPKYVLGLGRWAVGAAAGEVDVDWDWSMSWSANQAAGALPDQRTLAGPRLASASMVVLAVVALYFAGRILGGRSTGIAAALFLATNALVLLHGRRAMAEGVLILGVSAAVVGLLAADRRPWLSGLAAGIAASAKTSAAVWVPLGWLAVAWHRRSWAAAGSPLRPLAGFTAAALAAVVVLHPVLWRDPIGAARAMWTARQELVAAQVEMTDRVMPGVVLASPVERLGSLLAHLYFAPLQFAEAANYLEQTEHAQTEYLAVPGHNLMRGFAGGAVFLGLGLLGVATSIRSRNPTSRRRLAILLVAATIVQAAALLAFVPLSFQRYWVPLVPLACLWAGRGTADLIAAIARLRPGSR